jgi:hypothetical protein
MQKFREMNNAKLFAWIVLLSMGLLCAQNVKIHSHNLDHNHFQEHGHHSIETTAEHSHLAKAHLSTDISHADHHDEVVSETDASPNALLKNISSQGLVIALLIAVLTLLFPRPYQYLSYRRRDDDTYLPRRYLHSPTLRAPPR